MRLSEELEVRTNLLIRTFERGKCVESRDVHNIVLTAGRVWIAQLIGYASFSPLATVRDDRVKYIGLGIGGNRQKQPATSANVPPLSTAYPGLNNQTDTNPAVTALQRPVRLSGGTNAYPGDVGDVWLGQVAAPPVFSTPIPKSVTFSRLFTKTEISYGPYLSVPISEAGLFTSIVSSSGSAFQQPICYDTFDSLSKTTAFELEVQWTLNC